MILVNTIVLFPFQILDHAEWNGCSFADLVFPFFLVVMRISLVLSISKKRSIGINQSHIVYKIIQRTFIIFLLGMLLNIFPYHMMSDTFMTVRVYGVLQRIALCYFFCCIDVFVPQYGLTNCSDVRFINRLLDAHGLLSGPAFWLR